MEYRDSHNHRYQAMTYRRSAGRAVGAMRFIPLLLFSIYGIYYWVSNQATVPQTGRTQLVELNRDQEAALGLQSYNVILSKADVMQSGEAVDVVLED